MNPRCSPPNILFMVADDHRASAVASNGDPIVRTPHLDGLARRGVSFPCAYIHGGCSAAVCIPSRAALNTGASPFRAHLPGGLGEAAPRHSKVSSGLIHPGLSLLGETFRHAGYDTFATGKWHNDRASFQRSFTEARNVFFGGMCDHARVPLQNYDSKGLYGPEREQMGTGDSSVLFADASIAFIQSRRLDDAPFLCYTAFTAPHDPRTPPPKFRAMYDPAAMQLPPNFLPCHPFDNGELHIRDEQLAAFPRNPAEVRIHIAEYYGMVSHLDDQIGRILGALAASKCAEQTIVVYVADHGIGLGQHGLLGKQNLYDHSIRVPLMLAGPGVPAGLRPSGLVYSHDLFPTLCELTGIPVPATVESHPLAPVWRGDNQGRQSVFSAYKNLQRSLRRGDWKLIDYTVPGQPRRQQLFNLAEDPWEIRDLASDPMQSSRVTALCDELDSARVEFGAPPPAN